MTARTPNQGYVYPIAGDRPQDAAMTVYQTLTSQVEPDLLYLDSEYRRFERFPLVILEAKVPQQAVSNQYLKFDTVVEDTWGFADLARYDQGFTIPTSANGGYLVGAHVVTSTAIGGTQAVFYLNLKSVGAGNAVGVPVADPNTALATWGYQTVSSTSSDFQGGVRVGISGTNVSYPMIASVRLWAMYVRDL